MKTANVLVPHDEAAAEFIQKMKVGALMHADFKKVRNYQFQKNISPWCLSPLISGSRAAA